jgi:hypothetical protein
MKLAARNVWPGTLTSRRKVRERRRAWVRWTRWAAVAAIPQAKAASIQIDRSPGSAAARRKWVIHAPGSEKARRKKPKIA